MTEENAVRDSEKGFPLIKILLKRIWLLIAATVLGLLAGAGYAAFIRGVVYTASSNVILITQIVYPSESGDYTSVRDNLNFARVYLPTLATNITSPVYVNEAERIYREKFGAAESSGEKAISGGSIKVDYGEESLIFNVSYKDASKRGAEDKLEAVIESIKKNTEGFMGASYSEVRKVQSSVKVVADDGIVKYSSIGLFAGLILGVLAAYILYFSDRTVKDEDELKEITGAELLARVGTK